MLLALASVAIAVASLVWPGKYLASSNLKNAHFWVPLSLALFSTAGLAVSQVRQAFGVVAAVLLVSIMAAEVWLAGQPTIDPFAKELKVVSSLAASRGDVVDVRPIEQVVKDMRADGIQAFPINSVGTFLAQSGPHGDPTMRIGEMPVFPLTPVRKAELVYCNESGRWFTYSSDRFGFNNPNDLWNQPNEMMIIGDSFASGACLASPAKGLLDVLRSRYPNLISLASPSSGPLLQLAIFKEYGARQQPRQVVWFFSDHDILPFEQERALPWLRAYLAPGHTNDLAALQDQTDPKLRAILDKAIAREQVPRRRSVMSILRDSALLLHLRASRGLTSCPARSDEVFKDLERTFRQAKDAVAAGGGKLMVVYMPSSGSTCDLFGERSPRSSWLYGGALRVFSEVGLEVIDLRADYEMRSRPPEYYWFSGSHFTEAGAKWFAENILAAVEQHDGARLSPLN